MTATVLRADARSLPLPDASVDLIVTSPPIFRRAGTGDQVTEDRRNMFDAIDSYRRAHDLDRKHCPFCDRRFPWLWLAKWHERRRHW